MIEGPPHWPEPAQRVYGQLQTYEIVGASACAAAIVDALAAIAGDARGDPEITHHLLAAGAMFCALKPDTAAYGNTIDWLLHDLEGMPPPAAADTVERRRLAFHAYRAESLERLVLTGRNTIALTDTLLVHDFSGSVLAVLERLAGLGVRLDVFVTWGQPLDKGPLVAARLQQARHRVTLIPDTAIGRTMNAVDAVVCGVEAAYLDGSLANTVGTYPIALVAHAAGARFYGVTECIKLDQRDPPNATELTARLLKPWSRSAEVPAGVQVRLEVLDHTPPALVDGYITEQGLILPANIGATLPRVYADLDARSEN